MTDKPLTLKSFKEALAELKDVKISIVPTHIIVDPSWIRSDMKYLILGKDGWPVVRITGHPISYAIRCLIHGRAITLREHWDRMRKAEQEEKDG